MLPQTVAAVLDAVAKNWTVPDGIEVTLEANPSSVEAEPAIASPASTGCRSACRR
jgi:coproporphyrinogen III oxidase-like Fe-S oxidoreductase